MIAVDTNLLVYAHRSRTPQHRPARQAIERAAAEDAWGFAVASLAEFWAVATHPSSEGRPSMLSEAAAYLAALAAAGAQVWEPGRGFGARLAQLAVDLHVAGPRVFDSQIALTAFENGATELWTSDARFVKLPGLRLFNLLAKA